MTFCKRVSAFRKKYGLELERVAIELGVALSTMSRWENGKNQPRTLYLREFDNLVAEYESGKRKP